MQEKFIESLSLATKSFQTADHLTYITFPLIKEKRLFLRILIELNNAILNAINSILQYEYYWKRIQLYKDARENFRIFKNLAGKYDISPEQIKKLVEIMNLSEKHKKSPFEFVKSDRIVIMSDNMQPDSITIEKIKSFLIETKDLIRKASSKIKDSKI